jgi:hypothetical protein
MWGYQMLKLLAEQGNIETRVGIAIRAAYQCH